MTRLPLVKVDVKEVGPNFL